MSRNVVIVSPASNQPIRISDFNGATWGELKNHPSVVDHVGSNVEAVLRQGNVTLNREDAQLPEGDVTVFLVPTRNKAGMNPEAAHNLGLEIATAIEKAAAISSEEEVTQLKENLIEAIADFFEVDSYDIAPNYSTASPALSSLSDEDRKLMDDYNSYR
jgi:hypothetical protein